MSKRGNSSNYRSYHFRVPRDPAVIARPRLRIPVVRFSPVVRFRIIRTPVAIGDRRTFHPAGPRLRPLGAPRAAEGLVHTGSPFRGTKARLGFAVPSRVWLCARRRMRKEVFHALGKAGRGGMRPPRRTEFSNISC